MEKADVLGWSMIIIGLLPIVTFLFFSRPEYVVWFSNHTFLVLGLAVLFRSRFWVLAELCIGFVPETTWSIDFLWQLVTGEPIWGMTSYMFKNGAFDWFHLYSLQHILFVPLGLYALYMIGGPVKRAYWGSFAHFALVWPTSFAIGSDLNINCVFYACQILTFLPYYPITWPMVMVTHVLVVYGVLLWVWKSKQRVAH